MANAPGFLVDGVIVVDIETGMTDGPRDPPEQGGRSAAIRKPSRSRLVYKYQEFGRYFAQIAGGTEDLGVEELTEMGAAGAAPVYRGIHFDADPATLYRINYGSRLVTRILAPLTSFGCHDADYLYRAAREIDWSDFLSVDRTFAVYANLSNSRIRHSKYAALRVKDAIVDTFRESTGERPSVDTREPDVWFNLYVENDHATISLGTSAGSMHRRGYRTEAGTAPMQETVAAAVIRLTGWDGERPLYDPMCGSGTLLAEALMHYCRVPAGFLRPRFGFEAMPDFDRALWESVKREMNAAIRPLPAGLMAGSDVDPRAVELARENLRHLPGGPGVELSVADFRRLDGLPNRTIVLNPPYGVRMGASEQAGRLMKEFGDFLKQRCPESSAYIYAGDPGLLKRVGLRASWKKPLVSGDLDGRLGRYDVRPVG